VNETLTNDADHYKFKNNEAEKRESAEKKKNDIDTPMENF